MQNEVRIWLKNQPVRVKKWYMILSMEEFQSQRSERGVWTPQTLPLNPPLSDTIQLYDQWKLLQWGLRAGHLSSFLVPTAGHFAAQVSQPLGICHPRKKNGFDWCIMQTFCYFFFATWAKFSAFSAILLHHNNQAITRPWRGFIILQLTVSLIVK